MYEGMMSEICGQWVEQEGNERELIFPNPIIMGELQCWSLNLQCFQWRDHYVCLRRLTYWSPRRVRDFRERSNDPRSMFCVDVKYDWKAKGCCGWSSWVVAKMWFFPNDTSIDSEFGDFLFITNLDLSESTS